MVEASDAVPMSSFVDVVVVSKGPSRSHRHMRVAAVPWRHMVDQWVLASMRNMRLWHLLVESSLTKS